MGKSFDYRGLEQLYKAYQNITKKEYEFLRNFLYEEGLKTIAQIKKLTPVDTGALRNAWELSEVYRKGEDLYIVLFNPMEYASYVEDGHQQKNRFVPGSFFGDKFEYIPGYPFGMVLSNKWIPGYHMARISINAIKNKIPADFDRAFYNFVKELGGV